MRDFVVTGANGFLGKRVIAALSARGHSVRAITRDQQDVAGAMETRAVGDLLACDPRELVSGSEVVINCAARVHEMRGSDAAAMDAMNHRFAVGLAEAARQEGATRFVQLSSVAAITSHTGPGEIVTDETPPRPGSPYGQAKLDADRAIAMLADESFDVISLRPPVIIGAGAAAWFGMLNSAAKAGLPIPMGKIRNLRSFAFVENIADATACAATFDGMGSGAYIVTDSAPVSTAQLYQRLLALHGHPGRVWNWPPIVMTLAARALLRQRASSLLGSAAYDGARFRDRFSWEPEVAFDEALAITTGVS